MPATIIDGMSGSHRMGKLRSLIAASAVLILIPPAAEAFWWRYGSRDEALYACMAWMSKQGKFHVYREYINSAGETVMVWDHRDVAEDCHDDPYSSEFIGLGFPVKDGSRWPNGFESMPNKGKLKAFKRFPYKRNPY